MSSAGLSFDLVEREIRGRTFGVLSTVSHDGRAHSAGVLYGVSSSERPLVLYVTTNRDSKKARNISRNPNVSFAIPLPRRFLPFFPPNCVQFQGTAEIIPMDDEDAKEAFEASMVLRKTLELEREQVERKAVFVRIRPRRVIFTYGVGLSALELMRNIGAASSRVEIPPSRLQA